MKNWILVAGATTVLLGCPSENEASPCSDTDACGDGTTSGQTTTGSAGSAGEATSGSSSGAGTASGTTGDETTASETTSQDVTSDTGQAESSSTGEPDLCDREEFDEAPAGWSSSGLGAAVEPAFEDSALVLDVTSDGSGYATTSVRGAPSFDLSDVRVSALLLELPESSSFIETGFLLAPEDLSSAGIGFSIDDESVEVFEGTVLRESTLGSIALSEVQLPLRLDFTIVGDTISAGVSGPGGEQMIYEGAMPDGLAGADIALVGSNLSNEDPMGVARFDFVEGCPL